MGILYFNPEEKRGTLMPYSQQGTINRWLILSQGCYRVLEGRQRRSKVWTHKSKKYKTNQSTLYIFSLCTLLASSQSASWGKSPAMVIPPPNSLERVPRGAAHLLAAFPSLRHPSHPKTSEVWKQIWNKTHSLVRFTPLCSLHDSLCGLSQSTVWHRATLVSSEWLVEMCWEGFAVWFNELSFKRDEDISPCFYPLLFATYSTFDFLLNTRHYLFYFHVTSICNSLPLFWSFFYFYASQIKPVCKIVSGNLLNIWVAQQNNKKKHSSLQEVCNDLWFSNASYHIDITPC